MSVFLFDCTRCIENLAFQISFRNDSSLCTVIPLYPFTSNMFDPSHRQRIHAALGINWQNNITNEEVYAKSGLLPFSQIIRKKTTLLDRPLVASSESIYHTSLLSILQHLSVVFSVRRGQDQTWTLAKDFSTIWTQLTATSTMLLTSVLVSLLAWLTCSTPIFIVEERSNIYSGATWWFCV